MATTMAWTSLVQALSWSASSITLQELAVGTARKSSADWPKAPFSFFPLSVDLHASDRLLPHETEKAGGVELKKETVNFVG
jgi:hypothetical protein